MPAMEKHEDDKPWGRFQSTYMRELCTHPKMEDYTCATRHGVRDEQNTKTNVAVRFKFPTGVSDYEIGYCHGKPPALEDYGDNKQPNNERKVECAPLAGYNTTYNDQSCVLHQVKEDSEGKRPKGLDTHPSHEVVEDVDKEKSRHTFGPWNYTGQVKEDIFIQRDGVQRARKGMYYLPGYLGHIPMHNPPSSTAFDKRSPEKEKMLLYDLDQYSRELWPHYKGHKAQALVNVREPPPPTKETTYGYTNHMMQRQQDWAKTHSHTKTQVPNQHKKGGTKTFFTQGTSGTTSANGVLMAEKYYSFVRPLEGTLISFHADKALASRYLE